MQHQLQTKTTLQTHNPATAQPYKPNTKPTKKRAKHLNHKTQKPQTKKLQKQTNRNNTEKQEIKRQSEIDKGRGIAVRG